MSHSQKNNHGFTLVELIVAMGIAAILLSIATGVYIQGLKYFKMRMAEASTFRELVLMDKLIKKKVSSKVHDCDFGKIEVEVDGGPIELAEMLKSKFKIVKDIKFECLEIEPDTKKLRSWKNTYQPDVINYELTYKNGNEEFKHNSSLTH